MRRPSSPREKQAMWFSIMGQMTSHYWAPVPVNGRGFGCLNPRACVALSASTLVQWLWDQRKKNHVPVEELAMEIAAQKRNVSAMYSESGPKHVKAGACGGCLAHLSLEGSSSERRASFLVLCQVFLGQEVGVVGSYSEEQSLTCTHPAARPVWLPAFPWAGVQLPHK